MAAKKKTPKPRKGKAATKRSAKGGEQRVYSFSAAELSVLDDLLADARSDVNNCDASDLGIFIHNHGTEDDRAEALVAILPIARRVYERE